MVVDFLTRKKVKQDSSVFYEARNRGLLDHDIYINKYLKKYNIQNYLLFIRKENQYLVATWQGFRSFKVENLRIKAESWLIDFILDQHKMVSIEEVKRFYNECVIVSREQHAILRQEAAIWPNLGVTDFFPLFNNFDDIFGMLVCTGEFKNIKLDDMNEFLEAIYMWGKGYSSMNKENQAKSSIKQFSGFKEFVINISSAADQGELTSLILDYYLTIFKSTKGAFYTLDKSHFFPFKHKGVEHIKSLPKSAVNSLLGQEQIQVRTKKDLFYDEFGAGTIKVFKLDNQNFFVIKQIFTSKLEEDFLKAILQISRKMLQCV